jgi:hypothetical protein
LKNLECSSRGDKRFSAFYAKVTIAGVTDSIENWYQHSKRDELDNVPGKGRRVAYMINPFNGNKLPANCLTDFYNILWIKYFIQNPNLLEYAKGFDTFTDMFRGKCINCQADVITKCVKDFESFKEHIKQSYFYKDCLKKKINKQVNK